MQARTWLTGLGLAGALWVCGTARAATDSTAATRRSMPAHSQLLLGFSAGRGHDDNVLQLTRQSLDLFTNRPGPPRFLISRVGDMATIARGSLRWRGRLLQRRETRLELDAALHRYDHDRVFDWQQYELSATQELTASKRNLTSVELFGGRIPKYYLGEIRDIDESVAAQRPNNNPIRNSLIYAQSSEGLRLRQELLHGRFAFGAGAERSHRDFSQHFLERVYSNDLWRFSVEATPFQSWAAVTRVSWLRGTLTARGDLPDTLGVTQSNISYDHDGIGVSLGLPWGRGRWRGRFESSFTPEVRHYTTDNKFEIVRFGRENHRRDTKLRVTQRVWGPLEAVATWERLISRAEFHEGISFPPEQTNFNQEQFGIELRARWELALH